MNWEIDFDDDWFSFEWVEKHTLFDEKAVIKIKKIKKEEREGFHGKAYHIIGLFEAMRWVKKYPIPSHVIRDAEYPNNLYTDCLETAVEIVQDMKEKVINFGKSPF